MSEVPTTAAREQTPLSIQWSIEQSVINLANSEMILQNFMEFQRGGSLVNFYEDFMGFFRFTVNLTTCLQDVNPDDEVVQEVSRYINPPGPRMWSTAEDRAEERAREGLRLAQSYRHYLGRKGIISIGR